MKLVLSTSNIMGGSSTIRRDPTQKSNTELVSSLRANFTAHAHLHLPPNTNGDENNNNIINGDASHPAAAAAAAAPRTSYKTWTHMADDNRHELEIPRLDFEHSALAEEREQYDITAKLFYLPGNTTSLAENRDTQTREAVNLVLKELHMPSIDLLIISFPGIYFDEEEDCPDKLSTRGPVEAEPEPLAEQMRTWSTLEALHDEGVVKKLGIAEFGHDRLVEMLDHTRVRPSVDQVNLRDCCSVPRSLLKLAKARGVELLVHNDCSNILPRGTVRELLGPEMDGAGVLAEPVKVVGEKRKVLHGGDEGEGENGAFGQEGLKGEVQPQWVVKYTAVVKNRGVVENKGYFAVADLTD